MPFAEPLPLSEQQRADLNEIARSRSLPAGFVLRAKLILMLADGVSFAAIKEQLQATAPTISRWKQRFLEEGLEGLDTYHPGQPAVLLTPALRAKILAATRKKPKDGSTHWSCRKRATAIHVSKDVVFDAHLQQQARDFILHLHAGPHQQIAIAQHSPQFAQA